MTPTHDLNAAQVAKTSRAIPARRIWRRSRINICRCSTRSIACSAASSRMARVTEIAGVRARSIAWNFATTRGRSHPVMADVGCRNTVFGAEAQEASGHLDLWRAAGIRHFRLEFAHESAESGQGDHVLVPARAGWRNQLGAVKQGIKSGRAGRHYAGELICAFELSGIARFTVTSAGTVKKNVDPFPNFDSTQIRPPYRSAMR